MKLKIFISFLIASVFLPCQSISAKPISAYEAELAVKGWLQKDSRPLGESPGRQILNVEIHTDDSGSASFYIVNLKPSGYVIASADDLIEPIIAFANDGIFDPSFENPLAALINSDIGNRLSAIQHDISLMNVQQNSAQTNEQCKWQSYIKTARDGQSGFQLMSLACLCDVRVPPLIQSRWSQTTVCGKTCYNYYTPKNYPSGCLATAVAQLMRYFEYPYTGVGIRSFSIKVDGTDRTISTIGGDNLGGAYNWAQMVLKPDSVCSSITTAQRQAIGSICYDAGIAMKMEYDQDGSGASMNNARDALTGTFGYSNAFYGYNSNTIGTENLLLMINPSLDAGIPVVLGIYNSADASTGHAVLCDGYAYDTTTVYNRDGSPTNISTLYHHINMGWSGTDDAWYNLPDISGQKKYNTITSCMYNVFTAEKGEIISGRVVDPNNNPIAGAVVYAKSDEPGLYSTLTNYRGIYAFKGLPEITSYQIWVNIDGRTTPQKTVLTLFSLDGYDFCGNVWGVDFYADNEPNSLPVSAFIVDDNAPGDPAAGNPDISDPNEDGSAEHPFDSIQQAVDAAKHGDMVIIKRGIYTGFGNRDIDFKGKAITVTGEDSNDPNLVIIDCNASADEPHRAFVFQTYEIPKSVLSGVAITGGYSEQAGAIYLSNCARPTITKCIFNSNKAGVGGAVYNNASSPVITNCTFRANQADAGGAIYNYTETSGCNPVITDCIFYGNISAYNGGALYNNGPVTPSLTNCMFASNYSSGGGGAIRNIKNGNFTITNCIFSTNKAEKYGGGIRCSTGCSVRLINCTFFSNLAAAGKSAACTSDDQGTAAAGSLNISNSIFRDGGSELFASDGSAINVTYSCIRSPSGQEPWAGEGNINADPLFADAGKNDFHLKSQAGRYVTGSKSWITDEVTSPCIDTGDPLSQVGREPEPNGGRINMGAYGGTNQASKSYLN